MQEDSMGQDLEKLDDDWDEVEETGENDTELSRVLARKIDSFGLSTDILAVCALEGVVTLGDLYDLSEQSLIASNFSWEQVAELRAFIRKQGLKRRRPAALTAMQENIVQARVSEEWRRVKKTLNPDKRNYAEENRPYFRFLLSRNPLDRAFGRHMLVYLNENMVRSCVSKTRISATSGSNTWDYAIDLADLHAEGMLGLMRAAEDFDPRRGLQFSTYATWWVVSHVTRAIYSSGLISEPINVRVDIARYNEEMRNVTAADLAGDVSEHVRKKLGMSTEQYQTLLHNLERHKLLTPFRLDRVVGEDRSPYSYIQAAGTLNVEEGILNSLDSDRISEVVQRWVASINVGKTKKTLRMQEILRMRFGIGTPDNRAMTLEEVGESFDLTRERVRQIQDRGLGALADNREFLSGPDGAQFREVLASSLRSRQKISRKSRGAVSAVLDPPRYDTSHPLPFWMTRIEYLFYLSGGRELHLGSLKAPALIRPDWPFAWPMEGIDDVYPYLVTSAELLEEVSSGVFEWKNVSNEWRERVADWIGSSDERRLREQYRVIAAYVREHAE